MFNLSEIRTIRKKYKLNENGEIILTKKEEAKNPSEMSTKEKSYIESALFLERIITYDARINYDDLCKDLSDEELLEQIQTQFTEDVLNNSHYHQSFFFYPKKASDLIWKEILAKKPASMTYFYRLLDENGKKIQMLQRSSPGGGLQKSINYTIIDVPKSNFKQILKPTNPIYTPNTTPKTLSLTQKQKRRQFVDEIMQLYRKLENDKNYENREQSEER